MRDFLPMGNTTSIESKIDYGQNRHVKPHLKNNNHVDDTYKRDTLPPSMAQMEPRSPILVVNGKHLTDIKEIANISSQIPETMMAANAEAASLQESLSNEERAAYLPTFSKSSSYVSSLHSRKSSLLSNSTTLGTPATSPGLNESSSSLANDYFASKRRPSLPDQTLGQHLTRPSLLDSHRSYSSDNCLSTINSNSTELQNTTMHHNDRLRDIFPFSRPKSPNGFEIRIPLSSDDVSSSSESKLSLHRHHSSKDIPGDQTGYVMINGKRKKQVNIDEAIQRLLDVGYSGKKNKAFCLKNSEIIQICIQAREVFLNQPALLELSAPVKIVGDIHGQFQDLLRLFTKCGFPPSSNFLFLGDYVDRGKQSLETILLLLCYKIKYPENFFLLRGNHECANVTRVYGFYDECKRRCNIKIWKYFIDTFNTLPLTAIVAGKIFCVHGGLSPVLNTMDEIRNMSRPTDVPDFGLINDLLWSDPIDSPNEWEDNDRGVSYCYNKVAINKFINKFNFDLVCRAHMVVEDGYEFFNDRTLVTVFSAPNYCGEFNNWGAVMSVSQELLCSFELLDPLDSNSLKQVMKKGKQERDLANSFD